MATVTYGVRGMTCGACARNAESALAAVPGVRSAHVDLVQATATLESDRSITFERLNEALDGASYTLTRSSDRRSLSRVLGEPLVSAPLASGALLGLYLGLITLAQGWDHAIEQFQIDLWFVLALAVGFGIQVGLFTYLRVLHARMAAGGVGMAASTGTSTAAMLACCAHHLSDVLPILGVSGAAVFLVAYKTPLLWLGLIMNLAGIAYLVWQLRGLRAGANGSRSSAGEVWRGGFGPERLPATESQEACHASH